ncbi:spore coat protein [Alkalihalobacillus sp. LMS39]|uniref:spore coat protein n=1 Tax=Alkalihalobacillus sp. LMS39 TaxID=2924032 RepID=UPI001FB54C76|nr:spore coat protein [Alkalihalobacillus sp. LMS39]UOE92104.1 spore coat protein [Alkalihalobacillus sp. LMS39]
MNNQVEQDALQANKEIQLSEELIHIMNSSDVTVSTTDTKAAISLQASLQAAIAVVISISVADSSKAESIIQELMQYTKTRQETSQKIVIDNSQGVEVTTTDTQVALNLQLLLQVLLALLVELDIL